MKHAFVGSLCIDSHINKFNALLSKEIGVKTQMKITQDEKQIYVPEEKYEESIRKGNDIDIENCLVNWVDFYGNHIPLHYMSLMYGFLPETRRDTVFENFASSDVRNPIDIEWYTQALQTFLGLKSILLKYKGIDTAIQFLIKGPFTKQKEMQDMCILFNQRYSKSPFIEIIPTTVDGRLYLPKHEKRVENEKTKQIKRNHFS